MTTLGEIIKNQRSQRDDSRIQNKANDFTFKLQYDASIFSNRRQSDFTKCSLMISQREIMISQLVWLESSHSESVKVVSSHQSMF